MNMVWSWLMLTACALGMATGRSSAAAHVLMDSGRSAVELTLTLAGVMTLWSGLMEILQETGDVAWLGRKLRRLLAPLFPGLQDEACWAAMGMNMAANTFGLGNAATPAGIRAAQLLEKQGQTGLRALAMLLALNNTGLQLLPTTVMALRGAAGAANPADIWLPALAASCAATVVAAGLMYLLGKGGVPRG